MRALDKASDVSRSSRIADESLDVANQGRRSTKPESHSSEGVSTVPTRSKSELLSRDRRIARKEAQKGLWERYTSGNMEMRDIHTLERLLETHGPEAVARFEETGKLPRNYEFSHLFSALSL